MGRIEEMKFKEKRLTQILQLAAKSAPKGPTKALSGFVGVNPDQNAMHFASAEGKFCYCKIWVKIITNYFVHYTQNCPF
jgi:hypothetical protein